MNRIIRKPPDSNKHYDRHERQLEDLIGACSSGCRLKASIPVRAYLQAGTVPFWPQQQMPQLNAQSRSMRDDRLVSPMKA